MNNPWAYSGPINLEASSSRFVFSIQGRSRRRSRRRGAAATEAVEISDSILCKKMTTARKGRIKEITEKKDLSGHDPGFHPSNNMLYIRRKIIYPPVYLNDVLRGSKRYIFSIRYLLVPSRIPVPRFASISTHTYTRTRAICNRRRNA